jgi:hypothetical protein
MTADDLDYRPSGTSKLGDDVKKFIDELKPLTDLLPLVVKVAAFIGGALLVGYAAKEHFFYDLSSIAAIILLFITFFSFSIILVVLVVYSFISTLWIVVIVYIVVSWIGRRIRRPVVRQLRPAITWPRVVYSFLLFVWMAVLLAVKQEISWTMIQYMGVTGFLMGCCIVTSPLPGKSDRPARLFAFLGVPLLMFFLFVSPPSVFGSLLNSTMTILSFRSAPDQLVRLNEQAYRKVRDIAAYAGVTVFPCQVGKDIWVLREATLVWHGIGATAYLRIGIAGKPDASLLIPLPNDGVEVLYSTGLQRPQHCAAG